MATIRYHLEHETKRANSGRRLECVDAARGLAVVVMILDHVLVLGDALDPGPAPWWLMAVRLTVTRASLPLFMICTGILLQRWVPSPRRYVEVAGAALAVTALLVAFPNGVLLPEVLFVWLVVMAFAPLVQRYPVAAASIGATQAMWWPIGWHGYQPGFVAVFVAVGVLGGPATVGWCDRLPKWLRSIGRRPLRWYVGHLVVLSVIATVAVAS